MKLGEIKLEALKIMNINNDSVLDLSSMDAIYGEKRYAKFLNNMFNAINKAIDVINHKKVLPKRRVRLKDFCVENGKINNRFDVSKIDNFMSVDRIVFEDEKEYLRAVPFDREGELVVVSSAYDLGSLSMVYDTKVESINSGLGDNEDVPNLSDEFCRLIPYYIKFELYQEDEPSLAITAKNIFDLGIENLRILEDEKDCYFIEKVYSEGD